MALKPNFQIIANDDNLTKNIIDNIVSLSFNDKEQSKISIVLIWHMIHNLLMIK
ncbi:hypothetical protein [Campylobacter hyointestinalis]|uniref:hypothetical protein n=1 Tax=Campylobacter hyointestinalis TaxID=198 RepID=UPI00164EC6C2|nr:hypothetical protein [Campylobacter hyointestinalis]